MKRNKQPTHVSLVYEYLKGLGDFATVDGIMQATKVPHRLVMISLWHLRKHRAVESVVSEDALWWFATPEYDTRTKTVAERTPEERKRVRRRKATPPEA